MVDQNRFTLFGQERHLLQIELAKISIKIPSQHNPLLGHRPLPGIDGAFVLASLQTAAVKDGDDEWVINGQKVWTTAAHRSDSMFILVRTDPDSAGSKGLSVFHVDMKSPGIEVRPLYYMNGSHVYNEVFLKDVRVPDKDLVGGEGNGWQVTMATMNFERSGMGFFSTGKQVLERIIQYVKTTKRNGSAIKQPRRRA